LINISNAVQLAIWATAVFLVTFTSQLDLVCRRPELVRMWQRNLLVLSCRVQSASLSFRWTLVYTLIIATVCQYRYFFVLY